MQISGHVHGDERKLETAGEEAEHQQHVGAMCECFAQRLAAAIAAPLSRPPAWRPASPEPTTTAARASMLTAKIVSVCCQPNVSISATATGE